MRIRLPKNFAPSCAAPLVRAPPMKRTLTNLLPALALVLACVMGSDGFAGETIRYRGDGEPVVPARGRARRRFRPMQAWLELRQGPRRAAGFHSCLQMARSCGSEGAAART